MFSRSLLLLVLVAILSTVAFSRYWRHNNGYGYGNGGYGNGGYGNGGYGNGGYGNGGYGHGHGWKHGYNNGGW